MVRRPHHSPGRIHDQGPPAHIGITPVFFNEVAFDLEENLYKEVDPAENGPSLWRISGMAIRRYIAKGQAPPEWMMRPEVSETLLGLAADGVAVFEP